MATTNLAALIWSLMLFLAPAKGLDIPSTPNWMREDAPTYEARLKEMAFVIERVVLDESEAPIAPVAHPRTFSAVGLAVIGAGETRFAKDTYHGHNGQPECYRGPGQEARCDHGRSVGVFQVMVGAGKTAEGWTKADLFGDFEKETRVALHRIRQSVAAAQRCQLPASGWLNVYGSGKCEIGSAEASARVARMFKLFGQVRWNDGRILVSEKILARFAAAGAPPAILVSPPALLPLQGGTLAMGSPPALPERAPFTRSWAPMGARCIDPFHLAGKGLPLGCF